MRNTLFSTLLVIVVACFGAASPAADRLAEAARQTDRGFAALDAGDGAKARKLFTRAIKLAPSLPHAHRGLGDLAMQQGRFSDAVDAYRAELAGYPDPAAVPGVAHMRLGQALSRSGRWAEAIESYELGVADDPELAEAHLQLARAYLNVDRSVEAGQSLERAAALGLEADPAWAARIADRADDVTPLPPEPDQEPAHLTFQTEVTQLLAADDYVAALQTMDAYLEIDPDDLAARTLRAEVLARMGRYVLAESDLVLALARAPDSFDAQYQLAAVYRATGRTLEALQRLRALAVQVEQAEQRAKLLLSIGELERQMGNLDAAITAFEQAIEADSSLEPLVAPELASLYAQPGASPRTRE